MCEELLQIVDALFDAEISGWKDKLIPKVPVIINVFQLILVEFHEQILHLLGCIHL